MHLLYFVQYFPPEKASGLPLVIDLLKGCARHGWDVDVYTPTPTRGVTEEIRRKYAKTRKVENLFAKDGENGECLDGITPNVDVGNVTIHRMSLYREKTSFLQRTIRYSIFSLQCLLKALFIPADAIFTGYGPPTQGFVVGLVHKFTKKKVIFNPQDLFPDSLIIAGKATEQSKITKLGRKLERFAYSNSDVIITITEDMAKSIRTTLGLGFNETKSNEANNISDKTNVASDVSRVYVVQNWVDTEKIRPIQREDNALLTELDIPRNKFYVVYAGNLGKVQGVDSILDVAEKLKGQPNIHFVIFGNGSEEERIKHQAKQVKNLSNVSIFPLQPIERASEVYSLGDVSIVSCKPGTGKSGMPSKTWTIMATGTPIIAFFDLGGEMERIVKEADCGCCVQAGDVDKLAEVILALSNEDNQKTGRLKQWGLNARDYAVKNLSKDKAVQRYIEIIDNVVNS